MVHLIRGPAARVIFSLLVLLASVQIAGEAHAQTRIALQADGGLTVPIGAPARNSIGLTGERTEEGRTLGTPFLYDRYRNPALRVGLTFLLGDIEIRYTLERSTWLAERTICTTSDTVSRLGNGDIDDRAVDWTCERGERGELTDTELPPLLMHHLTGGLRWYATTRLQTDFYLVGFGGATLSTFDRDDLRRRIRVGPTMGLGGGVDFRLERTFMLNIDARYQLSLLPATARFTSHARRSSAASRPVTTAVFDSIHGFALTVGLRANFR